MSELAYILGVWLIQLKLDFHTCFRSCRQVHGEFLLVVLLLIRLKAGNFVGYTKCLANFDCRLAPVND